MRRYEKIMRAIDDGKTDEELAEMFPDKSITKKSMISTMRMYRLVHDQKTCKLENRQSCDSRLIMELYWARTGGEREWKRQG